MTVSPKVLFKKKIMRLLNAFVLARPSQSSQHSDYALVAGKVAGKARGDGRERGIG